MQYFIILIITFIMAIAAFCLYAQIDSMDSPRPQDSLDSAFVANALSAIAQKGKVPCSCDALIKAMDSLKKKIDSTLAGETK